MLTNDDKKKSIYTCNITQYEEKMDRV